MQPFDRPKLKAFKKATHEAVQKLQPRKNISVFAVERPNSIWITDGYLFFDWPKELVTLEPRDYRELLTAESCYRDVLSAAESWTDLLCVPLLDLQPAEVSSTPEDRKQDAELFYHHDKDFEYSKLYVDVIYSLVDAPSFKGGCQEEEHPKRYAPLLFFENNRLLGILANRLPQT